MLVLGALLLAACSGSFVGNAGGGDDGDDDGAGPDAGAGPSVDAGDPAVIAAAFFTANVEPVMTGNCAGCHASGTSAPIFMVAPDLRASLMAFPNLVIPGQPGLSRLYTYGASTQHSGPDFTADQAELVRQWIALEPPPSDGGGGDAVATDPMTPAAGQNSIDLSKLGADLAGVSLEFSAQPLMNGTYLTQLKVKTGVAGVHVIHPLFVTHCPDPAPDPVDSLNGVDVKVAAASTATLGGGTVLLPALVAGCQLSVSFETIAKDDGSGGGGGTLPGGCTAVGDFTTSAKPQLAAQCASCHAGGQAGATASSDLRKINDTTADGQAAACAQTRGKMNLTTETMSLLFQRVAPGQQTNHPLTLTQANFTTFQNAVVAWATKEQ